MFFTYFNSYIVGTKWKNLRSKLTPAYSPGKLKYMFGTIDKCGHTMTKKLQEIANEKGEVEIKEILARYTTDVIGSCAFGLECHCMTDPEAEFRLMGKRAFTQTVGDVLKMVKIIVHNLALSTVGCFLATIVFSFLVLSFP
ncbi:hypothetical protein C4B38_000295 [Diabrotica virgifera virgifera]|uniref:Cytochrome P450 6a9-like n=1 Tax=Diabrotica virgifera virgifera TaxID=50390 RepID=A0A6P7GPQ5_DIAVI|nr:hypothetical protein C4B38_000295 [Diabrotica virgifera virgifera]